MTLPVLISNAQRQARARDKGHVLFMHSLRNQITTGVTKQWAASLAHTHRYSHLAAFVALGKPRGAYFNNLEIR